MSGMKGGLLAQADVKRATVSVTVTRADGTVEDYGVVSYHHRNPVLRLLGNSLAKIRKHFNDRRFARQRKERPA